MEPYSYKPLALSKNEIRIIKFEYTTTALNSEIIHCTLENVSLDDYLPEFSEFLKIGNLECGPAASRWWKHVGEVTLAPTSRKEMRKIPITSWRLRSEIDLDTTLFGLDTSWMPEKKDSPSSLSEFSDLRRTANPSMVDRSKDITYIPARFTWGDFEAVSYCWGSDVRDKTVIVEGQVLRIATNLEAFLQKLRKLPEAHAGMGFWADGVCICQDDITEKNHQVKLMNRIYTQASSVVVWLGLFRENVDEATRIFGQTALINLEERRNSDGLWEEGSFESWFVSLHWPSLINILARDYWKRMWIIQELTLNQHMTLFMCGGLHLSRVMIWSAAQFCYHHSARICQSLKANIKKKSIDESHAAADLWQLAYDVGTLFRISEIPSTTVGNDLLDLVRKSKVKDSQDKVYGMLGLLPRTLMKSNEPDYLLEPTEVYLRFAKSLLQYSDNCKLETVLSWCSFSPSNRGPSWVPDWTQDFPRNHVHWLRKRQAAKQISNETIVFRDGRILHCKGLIIDLIESTSGSSYENIPFRSQISSKRKRRHATIRFGRYNDERGLKDAFARTLSQDHPSIRKDGNVFDTYWVDWDSVRDVEPPNEQLKDLWYGLRHLTAIQENHSFNGWEAFDRFRQTNADFDIFSNCLRDFFPDMQEYVRPSPLYQTYSRELTEHHAFNMSLTALALVGRRLVTTTTGYLGLAAASVQKTDIIAILYGCNFPVILRAVEDKFLYIGECYIDGLMDGEAIDAQERGEYDVVDINIV